jgi:heme oxygenase
LEEAVEMTKALTIKAKESAADQVESVLRGSFPEKSFEKKYQNFYFWYTVEVTEEEYHGFRQGVDLGMVSLGDAEIV